MALEPSIAVVVRNPGLCFFSSGLLLVTAFEESNDPEFAEEELAAACCLTLTPHRLLLAAHPEFSEVAKEPLLDINMNDSTELWLISWPRDQNPDFSQEVSLKLGPDGELGSFVGPSGKEYDLQSTAQKPDATVFVSSVSGIKVDRNTRVVDELPCCEFSAFQQRKRLSTSRGVSTAVQNHLKLLLLLSTTKEDAHTFIMHVPIF
ncbi:hypothetical protein FF1_000329 [Malus domestica]